MALSREVTTTEDVENARRRRQHRRIFILMLAIDLLLIGFVVFDVLRLLGIITIA
jgi:hypothetical protein